MGKTLAQIAISPALIEEMRLHVIACLPEEGCGLLGGQINGAEVSARIVIPVENTLHSPVRFRMDPMKQWEAFQLFEERGMELVGIFHSHPTGPDAPSATDLTEFYYPGTAFLIWSPDADGWIVRAFHITGEEPGAEKRSVAIPIRMCNL